MLHRQGRTVRDAPWEFQPHPSCFTKHNKQHQKEPALILVQINGGMELNNQLCCTQKVWGNLKHMGQAQGRRLGASWEKHSTAVHHGRRPGRKAGLIMGETWMGKLSTSWEKPRLCNRVHHGRRPGGKAECIMGEAQVGKLGASWEKAM